MVVFLLTTPLFETVQTACFVVVMIGVVIGDLATGFAKWAFTGVRVEHFTA